MRRLSLKLYHYPLMLIILMIWQILNYKLKACTPDFDCNIYISLVHSLVNTEGYAPHGMMRVFPSLLVRGLHGLGFSIEVGFMMVSMGAYLLFGLSLYFIFNRLLRSSFMAFSGSLLVLSIHHAMNIPLFLVYQACDALNYLIALWIIYFTLNHKWVQQGILSLVGVFTRQNLFFLSCLAFMYSFIKTKSLKPVAWMLVTILGFVGLSAFYQADEAFKMSVTPKESFYSFQSFLIILRDSRIHELLLALVPFLLFNLKPWLKYLRQNWFLPLYCFLIVVQPILTFHITGENFHRIALQGIWVLYFAMVCTLSQKKHPKYFPQLFFVYTVSLYLGWAMSFRVWLVPGFMLAWSVLILLEKSNYHRLNQVRA